MFEAQMLQRGFVFLSGEVGVMPELHQHREVEVNLFSGGEVTYLFGGTLVTLPATQMAVFWAMIPHQLVKAEPKSRYYCVHLPLARFLQWQMPSEFTSRLLHGEIIGEHDAAYSARDLSLFAQWHCDLESSAADVNHVLLLELEARIRRLAWSVAALPAKVSRSSSTEAARDRSFDRVEQMAVYITDNYQEHISTSDIAAAAGLHPKYAMALFRERCGVTIGEYLAQQRISQAQRLLATTEKKIVDIAFASGFGSVSQFYDTFSRYCGQSPKDFRSRQQNNVIVAPNEKTLRRF